MAKDYYDDMDSQHSRPGGRDGSTRPSRTLIVTIVLGIAICVVVIIVWYRFFPQANQGNPTVTISQPAAQVAPISDAPTVEPEVPVVPVEAATQKGEEERRQAVSLSDRPQTTQSNPLLLQYADHRVAEGEDLTSIAALYGLRTQTLISVNQIRNVQAIREEIGRASCRERV